MKFRKFQGVFDHFPWAKYRSYTFDRGSVYFRGSGNTCAGSTGLQGEVFAYIHNSSVGYIISNLCKRTLQYGEYVCFGDCRSRSCVLRKVGKRSFAFADNIRLILKRFGWSLRISSKYRTKCNWHGINFLRLTEVKLDRI